MKSAVTAEGQIEEMDCQWDIRNVKDVVENGLCTFCGACIALCDKIKAEKEVADVSECPADCPTCVPCPRFELLKPEQEWKLFGKKREDETLGNFIEAYTAQASDEKVLEASQDGGIVTSFLKYLLESKEVDGVISVKGTQWKPEGFLARNFKELISGAGTKYTSCPSIVEVARSITQEGLQNVAFIGVPCQVQAIREIQDDPDYKIIGDRIKVVAGLFCMESYYHTLLEDEVIGKLGLKLSDITKFDIKGKNMSIFIKGKDEPIQVPLKDIKEHTRDGCHMCLDFSAELADVSIGSVGSPRGFSTVLTRTKIGDELYKKAVKKGAIKSKSLDSLEDVRKISRKKQKANLKKISEKIPTLRLTRQGGVNLARIYRTYRWKSH